MRFSIARSRLAAIKIGELVSMECPAFIEAFNRGHSISELQYSAAAKDFFEELMARPSRDRKLLGEDAS
jgi:hypothetical protein